MSIVETGLHTVFDVLPIAAILFGFQFLVIRRRPPKMSQILAGFVYVLVGLTLFLVGLEQALFPIGETMATQLTAPEFIGRSPGATEIDWRDYKWVYAFAAAIEQLNLYTGAAIDTAPGNQRRGLDAGRAETRCICIDHVVGGDMRPCRIGIKARDRCGKQC